jgi:hypothetical protein
MGGHVSPDDIARHWVHSHEEDTAAEMVFRPATFDLPPSRGRASFELKPDRTYIEGAIGPADVPRELHGVWSVEDEGGDTVLNVRSPSGSRSFKVISVDADRLVISKEES